MAGYIKATYRAGPVTVVERYYSPRYRVRAGRGQREKPTPERVAEVNERRSEFKLWLTLLENFKPGDLHLVLTYRKENRPADKSLLKKDMQAFLRKCRAVYKKQGRELRYIWVCEYESTAPHFHVILPRIDPGLLQDIWKQGAIRPGYLYAEGQFKPLAAYLIKETRRTFRQKLVSGRRWNPSKNLRKPRITIEETGRSRWRKDPKVPKGYMMLGEVQNGVHELFGTPYQYYELLQITTERRKE